MGSQRKDEERPHEGSETGGRGRAEGRQGEQVQWEPLRRWMGREGSKGRKGEGKLAWYTQSLWGTAGPSEWSPRVRTVGLEVAASYMGPGVWRRVQEHPIYCCAALMGPSLLTGAKVGGGDKGKMGWLFSSEPCEAPENENPPIPLPFPSPTPYSLIHPPTYPIHPFIHHPIKN